MTAQKYWAFISYSHQDKVWGGWPRKNLDTYRIPTALVGTNCAHGHPVPKRIYPAFRDGEELPTSANLGDQIQQAIRGSRFLLVISSPRSAKSRWVDEEIRYFKSLGRVDRVDRVLPIIVDGEPNAADKPQLWLDECFPLAVRYMVTKSMLGAGISDSSLHGVLTIEPKEERLKKYHPKDAEAGTQHAMKTIQFFERAISLSNIDAGDNGGRAVQIST